MLMIYFVSLKTFQRKDISGLSTLCLSDPLDVFSRLVVRVTHTEHVRHNGELHSVDR